MKLPVPENDGAADHLPGRDMPACALAATDGRQIRLDELAGLSVIFVYPGIGGPGIEDLLEEWTAIPGARGCTPEACSFRDELAGFAQQRAQVYGLSSQSHAAQAGHVAELGLPYPLLSDEAMRLRRTLELPTFHFHGRHYYKRLTLVIADSRIEAVLYPVFPPDKAAEQALQWLRRRAK
jgi:peroxiredoxin